MTITFSDGGHFELCKYRPPGDYLICWRLFFKTLYPYLPYCQIEKSCHKVHNYYEFDPSQQAYVHFNSFFSVTKMANPPAGKSANIFVQFSPKRILYNLFFNYRVEGRGGRGGRGARGGGGGFRTTHFLLVNTNL